MKTENDLCATELWLVSKLKSHPPPSEPAELQKCVFPDSLVTVSEGGRHLGKFNVTVEFARKGERACVLLHAQSQGAIDGSPCGTSVTGERKDRCISMRFSTEAYLNGPYFFL